MQPNLKASLVKYQYDALNRLVASTPSTQDGTQRFYLKDHLITEIQGKVQRSIMQHEDQLLAQQQRQGSKAMQTALFATDPSRSVLCLLDAIQAHAFAYPPYGHSPLGNGLLSLLGFTGERLDPVTGRYLLGNGYRAFNPVLMRFNSPDRWSPFGEGGLNVYAYCLGDPVNLYDPTGHFTLGNPLKGLLNLLKLRTPSASKYTSRPSKTTDYRNPLVTQQKPPLDPLNLAPSRFQPKANTQHATKPYAPSSNTPLLNVQNKRTEQWIQLETNRFDKVPKELHNIETQNSPIHKENFHKAQAIGERLNKLSQLMNNTRQMRFINDQGNETLRIHNKVRDFAQEDYRRIQRQNR